MSFIFMVGDMISFQDDLRERPSVYRIDALRPDNSASITLVEFGGMRMNVEQARPAPLEKAHPAELARTDENKGKRYVMRRGRPELGIGEVVETRPSGYLRVNFAEYALILEPGDVYQVSKEEARGRLYAAD